MLRLLLIILSIMGPLVSETQPKGWEAELSFIDEEMSKLRARFNMYKAQADQEEDLAQRLQFEGPFKDEARLAYRREEILREKMVEIDVEIRILEKKKRDILKYHLDKKCGDLK